MKWCSTFYLDGWLQSSLLEKGNLGRELQNEILRCLLPLKGLKVKIFFCWTLKVINVQLRLCIYVYVPRRLIFVLLSYLFFYIIPYKCAKINIQNVV